MPPLNVVALISGGKDSFYSILHCVQNGHNVVALANLHPSTANDMHEGHGEGDDINSFMYQTVGHSIIPLYGSALKLPLYRRGISGTATQTGRYYMYTSAGPLDETEDLIPLLKEVLKHHPEVNAISSGAILSTYQRTRIESVAIRLGLTPLAFLWQYPALPPPVEREDSITGLLDDMAAAGCDARIIKTASGGVKDSMLWANVAAPKTRNQLVAAMAPFSEGCEFWLRGSVLGEGGEYETLAINGPSRVWKQRIVVDEAGNTVVQNEGGASYLRMGNAHLVEQDQAEGKNDEDVVRVPPLCDPEFAFLEKEVSAMSPSPEPTLQTLLKQISEVGFRPLRNVRSRCSIPPFLKMSVKSTSASIVISNLTTTECNGAAHKAGHIMTLLRTCIHSLNRDRLPSEQLSVDDIVFTSLLLASMSDFTSVNAEYGKIFTAPNPPARVTIACGGQLPDNAQVGLSVMLDTGPRQIRRGLHVQSRSYWAPANIGPYSQAISVPFRVSENARHGDNGEVVHVAGQIPLVPRTMEMLKAPFLQQTILSLQHLWRVGQERSVDLWTHGVAFLADSSKSVEKSNAIREEGEGKWDTDDVREPKEKSVQLSTEEGQTAIKDLISSNKQEQSSGQDNEQHAQDVKGGEADSERLQTIWQSWKGAHARSQKPRDVEEVEEEEEGEGLDVWDLRYNLYRRRGLDTSNTSQPRKPSGKHLHPLPNLSVVQKGSLAATSPRGIFAPPLLIAQVDSLPRSAPIEWHSLGLGSMRTTRPRIKVYMTEARLAGASHCTILADAPQQDSPRAGDETEAADTRASSDTLPSIETDFVTLQVYPPDEMPGPEPAQSSVSATLSTIADLTNLQTWTIAHGTVYVAGAHGWSVIHALQQSSAWDGLVVIPCHTVWGATIEPSERVRQLSLGLVLRLDRPSRK
jgi:diphthine-ammonia ligase